MFVTQSNYIASMFMAVGVRFITVVAQVSLLGNSIHRSSCIMLGSHMQRLGTERIVWEKRQHVHPGKCPPLTNNISQIVNCLIELLLKDMWGSSSWYVNIWTTYKSS